MSIVLREISSQIETSKSPIVHVISPLGGASEIANYGEYSGAPSESQTYEYAKTILSLMTRRPNDLGKCLIIGGGIANFTNVASTFKVRILVPDWLVVCHVT